VSEAETEAPEVEGGVDAPRNTGVESPEAWDRFVAFAETQTGDIEPGVLWTAFAAALRKHPSALRSVFEEALHPKPTIEAPVNPPPATVNYDDWTEPKRRAANLDALRVLRRLQNVQEVASSIDLSYLRAYTGWGGIDVRQLPADPILFPPEYVQGIEEWATAASRGQVPASGVFAGLRHQFFTPLTVCEAMWALARRVSPFSPSTALEPTAGIGRFLQATPGDFDVLWTAVENDPLLTQLIQAAYPSADVTEATFERFYLAARKAGRKWDLIPMNPPYGERPMRDRETDREGIGWSNHSYFVERASQLLRPGGVLVAITPASEILGTDVENLRLRQWLFSRAHFAGAVFPPSTIFPYVNPGMSAFAIHVWVGLSPDAPRRLSFEDQRIVEGGYLDTLFEGQNVIGEWVEAVEGVRSVRGTFDPAQVVGAMLRPLGVTDLDAIKAWRRANPAEAAEVIVPSPPPPREEAEGPKARKTLMNRKAARPSARRALTGPVALTHMTTANFGVAEEAVAFAYRVQRFGALAALGDPASLQMAEGGRAELRADLEEFVRRYGNPHAIDGVADNPMCGPLLAVVQAGGGFAPVLSRALSFGDNPVPGSDVFGIIDWYSQRYGVCTERDLARHVPAADVEAALPDLLLSEAYAVEPRAEENWYYRKADYLTGDLYAKLDAVEAAIGGAPGEGMREKLQWQKGFLLMEIDPRGLVDITVTPRSGFVPLECLQAYAIESMSRGGMVADVEFRIEQGLLRVDTKGGVNDVQKDWLRRFLGYYNRQLSVVDPDEEEAKRTDVFQTADVSLRLKLERDLEEKFQQWLAVNESWRLLIEDKYNRLFRGHRMREYGGEPLGLARNFGGQYTPQLHQNASARRASEKRGGIVALDVGGGKSGVGAVTIANLRQQGLIRRPLVVVPNNIIFKWYKEIRRYMPDYRVGIIGYSLKGGGVGATQDSASERSVKWRKFAEGAYDVLIVPYSNFVNDIALTDASIYNVLSKILWLQRKLGIDAEERRLVERRIESAYAEIRDRGDKIQKLVARGAAKDDDRIGVHERIIATTRESIERWREKLSEPSASEIEQVRTDMEGITAVKPFRPRMKAQKPWARSWKRQELLDYLIEVGFAGEALSLETGEVFPEKARQFVVGDVGDLEAMARFDWKGSGKASKERLVEVLATFFPPMAGGTVPRPGLITFEELNVDFMVVDEAHNFKNVWYPVCRLGVDRISYMGSCGQKIKPQPWDMFLKCQYLLASRGSDGGVLLLTATPIKNGPIEIYNLLSLVSRHVWMQREVTSSEEFVDRYCRLGHEVTVNPSTFGAEMNLSMSGFQNLDGRPSTTSSRWECSRTSRRRSRRRCRCRWTIANWRFTRKSAV